MSNTILITGSSTGIGRATVRKFQQEGWNVIATMRNPEKETELNKLERVLVTKLDVQQLDSIDSAIKAGLDVFGKIDVVLNNAGYGLMGTFESTKRESVNRQFGVNVFGLFDVTRAMLPHFRANKSGLFINITSIGGKITFPVSSMYHATKFAVEGFSESLQYELASIGVGVKIVEPGGVATDFGGRSMDFQHDNALTEYNPFVAHVMPIYQGMMAPERMSAPEVIAKVIYTAATDGKDQLRYRAGDDAGQILTARENMPDAEFFGMIKGIMGIN